MQPKVSKPESSEEAIKPARPRILLVEDDDGERRSLERLLVDAGYDVNAVNSADKAIGFIGEGIDIVLTDLEMGEVSGLQLLRHWKAREPAVMFLIITGHGEVSLAIEAVRAGAYYYMTKPLDIAALMAMLRNMVREFEQSRSLNELQTRLEAKVSMKNIVGQSPSMQRVYDLIRRSSQAFSTVLILGESGTGKELVAEAIHQHSPRRAGPFLAVNCAAMAPSLVESELFGHERGAFTGATEKRIGLFEAAQGGTLFIDEIGDFDMTLQVKLLRVLESRSVTAVGSSKELKVDTRVLAATSRNLNEMLAKGQFREDLYYRLNVITIDLPPLRRRTDDIPLLIRRFMDRVNEQNSTHVNAIDPDVVEILQRYHWPGNVRELLNVIERMIVLNDKNTIEMDDLPAYIRTAQQQGWEVRTGEATPAGAVAGAAAGPLMASGKGFDEMLGEMTLSDIEGRAIVAAMRKCNNNRTRAARSLGISVRTLQRKLTPENTVITATEPLEVSAAE